jgi:antirestriction protein ArdC
MRRVARASSVFNVAQVDGFVLPGMRELPAVTRLARAEALVSATRADIRHGGDVAFVGAAPVMARAISSRRPMSGCFRASPRSDRSA